jgi:hypothetical protein
MALTNSKFQAVEAFFEGASMIPDDWRKFVNFRTDNVPSMKLAAMTGLGDVPTWNGTADLGDTAVSVDDHHQVPVTASQYAYQARISRVDSQDIPTIVADASRKIGMSIASTYASLAYTLLDSNPAVLGADLFATDHPTAGGGTRSNRTASALDRTSFAAAISAFRRWKNVQNQVTDYLGAGLVMIVPAELEETAKQIVMSPFHTVSNVQGETNIAGTYNTEVIVSGKLSALDANNWYLFAKAGAGSGPFTFWERLAPEIRLTEDPDTLHQKITCDFAVGTAAGPEPDFIYGGLVS